MSNIHCLYAINIVFIVIVLVTGPILSFEVEKTGCSCVKAKYDCGCCAYVKIPKIGLDDDVCANVTYLPKEYGVSFIVTFGGHVIINDTVSARNPPPICVAVPDLKKFASICVDLYNLDISKGHFSGCVDLEARLYHIFVEKVKLGCFNLGKDELREMMDNKAFYEESINKIKELIKLREQKKWFIDHKGKNILPTL